MANVQAPIVIANPLEKGHYKMALKYICDFCGELAEWQVKAKELTDGEGTVREIHIYSQADSCTTDLSNAVMELVKIHAAHDYDENTSFHSIQLTSIDQNFVVPTGEEIE